MTETPPPAPSAQVTSVRRFGFRTPATGVLPKTPRIHRLLASAGPKTPHKRTEAYKYEGLLGKTWRAHTLSPLFKFKTTEVSLRQYSRSLDVAFSKGNSMPGGGDGEQERTRSWFQVYHGLSFHAADPDAVRVQVTERRDNIETVVLTAVLACVDVGEVEVVEPAVSRHFSYYPLLLVSGTKTRAQVFIHWLQRHFDCRSSPLEFSDCDLRWMLALGCRLEPVRAQPVLLQYDLQGVCEGINTIDCKFESPFCKQLWDKLQAGGGGQEFMAETQVEGFVTALETHLEYTMHVIFTKLNLKEVGTPLAYVSREGKIKLLDSRGVYVFLHLMCQVISDRLMMAGTTQ